MDDLDKDDYSISIQSFCLLMQGNDNFQIVTFTKTADLAMYGNFVKVWADMAEFFFDVNPKLN